MYIWKIPAKTRKNKILKPKNQEISRNKKARTREMSTKFRLRQEKTRHQSRKTRKYQEIKKKKRLRII